MPTHNHAIRIKKVVLSRRQRRYNRLLFPTRTIRTVGSRIRMNATGISHNKTCIMNKKIFFCVKLFRVYQLEDHKSKDED
jgi:hypothetical protein